MMGLRFAAQAAKRRPHQLTVRGINARSVDPSQQLFFVCVFPSRTHCLAILQGLQRPSLLALSLSIGNKRSLGDEQVAVEAVSLKNAALSQTENILPTAAKHLGNETRRNHLTDLLLFVAHLFDEIPEPGKARFLPLRKFLDKWKVRCQSLSHTEEREAQPLTRVN